MAHAHSKLCSERVQAWLAHQIGLTVQTRSASQRGRLLSQAIEALIGEMTMRDGVAFATEKVISMLEDYLPDAIVSYLNDRQGSSLPAQELPWVYTQIRSRCGHLWQARKGNIVGIGESHSLAREDAVFQYYFGVYPG